MDRSQRSRAISTEVTNLMLEIWDYKSGLYFINGILLILSTKVINVVERLEKLVNIQLMWYEQTYAQHNTYFNT